MLNHPSRPFVLRLAFGFAGLSIFPWLAAELARVSVGPWIAASFDAPIVEFAAAHRVQYLTSIMKSITAAGSEPSLWAAVLIAGAVLASRRRSWRPLLVLLIAMIGAVSLDRLIKSMVGRARPPISFWATSATSWSFPSGHANESAAVCLSLGHLFADNKNSSIKTLTYVIAFATTLLIGASRVYLGVHWPTDVICGWAIGGAWSAIVLAAQSYER